MNDWENKLMNVAGKLKQVEIAYYEAVRERQDAEMARDKRDSELIRTRKVNMKNEEYRNADLWEFAKQERERVVECKKKIDKIKGDLHYWQNVMDIMLVSAKLEKGTRD